MTDMPDEKDAKTIKANNLLQAKVGSGPLDPKVVQRCQDVMDSNTFDFTPLADEYLAKLSVALNQARSGEVSLDHTVQSMREAVMQLKAHASIFRYLLVGNLANVMLSFLEHISTLDQDVINIVDAHHRTLKAIVAKKMEGNGGEYGLQLEEELKDACKRYYAKKKI
jgi:hypothetical protein